MEGHGLATAMVGTALQHLSGGCSLAFARASGTEERRWDFGDQNISLAGALGQLGFTYYRRDVYSFDLTDPRLPARCADLAKEALDSCRDEGMLH